MLLRLLVILNLFVLLSDLLFLSMEAFSCLGQDLSELARLLLEGVLYLLIRGLQKLHLLHALGMREFGLLELSFELGDLRKGLLTLVLGNLLPLLGQNNRTFYFNKLRFFGGQVRLKHLGLFLQFLVVKL